MVYLNGFNTGGGYFYVNTGGGYGVISDERIKKDIHTIAEDVSVKFIEAINPTSFCLKEQTCEGGNGISPAVCSCCQDGWLAQNVLEACEKSGASKSVINHWYDYEQELKLPEEDRKTLIGVSDRPILSHTVNVVKSLLKRIEVLEQREQVWVEYSKQQEQIFNDYKAKTDARLEKMASLISQLM
jgi:hypothetical protein